MGFWKAIGLGIGLLVIKIMMPEVFDGLKHILLTFFSTLTDIMAYSKDALEHGQTAALTYPQIPAIR